MSNLGRPIYHHYSEEVNIVHRGLVINYGEGGYKMGKSRFKNVLRPPPPQDRVKLFAPPLFLKEWKLFVPPPTTFNMAITSR